MRTCKFAPRTTWSWRGKCWSHGPTNSPVHSWNLQWGERCQRQGGEYIAACRATGGFAGNGGGSRTLFPVAPAACAVCPQATVGGAPGRSRGAGEGGAAAGAGSPRERRAAVPHAQRGGRHPLPHRRHRGAPHRHVAHRRPAPHAAGGAVGAFLRACEPRAALTKVPPLPGQAPGASPSDRGDGAFHRTLALAFPQPA